MKLPPLNALRAFESVARLGSVKLAAAELFVTPAAVSQQLRSLEQHLGLELFERLPRELRLTGAALDYQRVVSRHLRGIAEATERLRPRPSRVAISVVPSFATLWVSPRLPQFLRLHPDIEVRLEAEPSLVDLVHGPYDLAIREGGGRYRSTEVAALFPVALLPVASPDYVRSLTRNRRFDWTQARLLHEENAEPWERWFESRGLKISAERSVLFSHGMMALAAAAEGEGVALASYCLVETMVRGRRLKIVDPHTLPTGDHYWLAWPATSVRPCSAPTCLFRDWLIDQARLAPAPVQR